MKIISNIGKWWGRNHLTVLAGVTTVAVMIALLILSFQVAEQRKIQDHLQGIIHEHQEQEAARQDEIERLVKTSNTQHNKLFKQIECLVEVSVVASRGNNVVVTDLTKCKYTFTPIKKEPPQIIIQDSPPPSSRTRGGGTTKPPKQPEEPNEPGNGNEPPNSVVCMVPVLDQIFGCRP